MGSRAATGSGDATVICRWYSPCRPCRRCRPDCSRPLPCPTGSRHRRSHHPHRRPPPRWPHPCRENRRRRPRPRPVPRRPGRPAQLPRPRPWPYLLRDCSLIAAAPTSGIRSCPAPAAAESGPGPDRRTRSALAARTRSSPRSPRRTEEPWSRQGSDVICSWKIPLVLHYAIAHRWSRSVLAVLGHHPAKGLHEAVHVGVGHGQRAAAEAPLGEEHAVVQESEERAQRALGVGRPARAIVTQPLLGPVDPEERAEARHLRRLLALGEHAADAGTE